jgi:rhodanese-related sulfurtransferase
VDPAELDAALAKLPREEAVALVCRTGEASNEAAEKAQRAGSTQVLALTRGLLGWEGAGLPTYSTREGEELSV